MNKTVRILSISVAAAAAAFLSGCSSVDMGPATVVDHSTYSDGAAPAPVQTPSLLPGGIVDSGRTHTVAVGDTIYNISVRYGLSAEQLQQLNAITDPTQLRLGQVLRLPASVNAPRAYTGNPQVRVNRVTNDTVLETAPIRNAETVPAAGETTATSSAASADAAEAARKKAEAEAAAEKVRTQAEAAKSQAQQKLNAVTPGQRMIWPVRGKIKSDFAKNTFGLEIAARRATWSSRPCREKSSGWARSRATRARSPSSSTARRSSPPTAALRTWRSPRARRSSRARRSPTSRATR